MELHCGTHHCREELSVRASQGECPPFPFRAERDVRRADVHGGARCPRRLRVNFQACSQSCSRIEVLRWLQGGGVLLDAARWAMPALTLDATLGVREL